MADSDHGGRQGFCSGYRGVKQLLEGRVVWSLYIVAIRGRKLDGVCNKKVTDGSGPVTKGS